MRFRVSPVLLSSTARRAWSAAGAGAPPLGLCSAAGRERSSHRGLGPGVSRPLGRPWPAGIPVSAAGGPRWSSRSQAEIRDNGFSDQQKKMCC